MNSKFIKHDEDKLRWDLVPWDEVQEVVKVLHYGAKKYEPDNWKKKSPNGKMRLWSATFRHLHSWWKGEKRDPESKLLHLAHAVANILFLMWHQKNTK
jgi:hypothetical protein